MPFTRSSGILLHPTSLPGPYGIGDLGPEAYRWIDFLAGVGCRLWQLLPLSPTGYGDSPYQAFSAFAGNPYLISPDLLANDGLLSVADLNDHPRFPAERVDFGPVIIWKLGLLDQAYANFQKMTPPKLREEYYRFQADQASWLDDFAIFMALKEYHGGAPWHQWDERLRDRDPQALLDARQSHRNALERQIFRQFIFFRQWNLLHDYAKSKGIQVVGDVPIFVAHDSSDVWARPELFFMEDGKPTVVAGVPPDYYSPTGQLWGNPLYRWDVHSASGYEWWLARLRAVLKMVDIIRLDHFRGFSGYWEVPAGMLTAVKGRWAPGPGADFFTKVGAALGELPLIAEDLGDITPDVVELRNRFNLPGMKIMQFAFGTGPDDKFLPHNFPRNCVVYTGTHDNDTTRAWFNAAPAHERDFCLRYLGCEPENVVWSLLREIWKSVAVFALAPMQDLLELGNEARMNYPGRPGGNWTWRMPGDVLSQRLMDRLRELNRLYSRAPQDEEAAAAARGASPHGGALDLPLD